MSRSRQAGPTLVAVAHGSRRRAAQATIRALLAAVRAARPGLAVREAYIELASPSLPEVLATLQGARTRVAGQSPVDGDAVVVPLLLGNGYHIAHDVAAVASFHRPGTPCAPALGPDPLLVAALAARLAEAEHACGQLSVRDDIPRTELSTGPVVLAVAGSSDPRSHADAETTAALLAQRLGRPVVAAYHSATKPSVVEAVAALRAAGHPTVAVATYLLSPGRFADEVKACGADVVSDPLGVHPALVELVLRRYDDAALGDGVSPSSWRRRATLG